MGWERRGTHQYYYRKERDGSRVKSVYVGRGEIANMISQFQSGSCLIEKLARQTKTANDLVRQGRTRLRASDSIIDPSNTLGSGVSYASSAVEAQERC